ncbi:MAG: FHA domain-containing protein [Thermoguttaceae bacterium]|nr:FHA domain-containing protein [Thermoguttaceae bacterium]
MDIKLSIYQDQSLRLTKTIHLPCTIGRSPRCDIIVGHPLVSRQHCELYEDHGLVMIRDLGSQNGTHFKGATIGRGIVIAYGEEFSIGMLRFVIDKVKGDTAKMAIYPEDAAPSPSEEQPREETPVSADEKIVVSQPPAEPRSAVSDKSPDVAPFDDSPFTDPLFTLDEPPTESLPLEEKSAEPPKPAPEPKRAAPQPQKPAPAPQKPASKPAGQLDDDDFLAFLTGDDGAGGGAPGGDDKGGEKDDSGDFGDVDDDNPFFTEF